MTSWLASLPHQIPFRAASSVVRSDATSIEGIFRCTANDELLPGAWPLDIMLLEAMAQFAGGLAFHETKGPGYLSAIDRCTVDRLIEPGESVHITVVLEASFGGIFRFRGAGTVEGVEVVRGTFYLASPPTQTESPAPLA